jgi:hypothetical protein
MKCETVSAICNRSKRNACTLAERAQECTEMHRKQRKEQRKEHAQECTNEGTVAVGDSVSCESTARCGLRQGQAQFTAPSHTVETWHRMFKGPNCNIYFCKLSIPVLSMCRFHLPLSPVHFGHLFVSSKLRFSGCFTHWTMLHDNDAGRAPCTCNARA